ncbi:hypothetical protein Gotri_023974 [Gossypium trilobum]|uniref:Uncharacterized protein n=1 Tax=Gossypium trilobum TaxID=34281 RepID=A0A7J9DL55_9ROSI|nr:hypothetical protein [Gossypium trilobum]
MPDKSRNLIYLRWLLKIIDFRGAVNSVPLEMYATIEMHETDNVAAVWILTIDSHELACDPEYMPWFRIHGKPYLYGEKVRRQHPHTSRPRRPHLILRAGKASLSSASTQEPIPRIVTPMPTPPTVSWIFRHLSPMYYTLMPFTFLTTKMPTTMFRPSMFQALTESPLVIPSVYGT